MFEPVRGGTRGGQAEFKWTDVAADKDREHYLGHSINAPTGRWQKNKDIHWYSRDQQSLLDGRDEEIRQVKELEANALAVALGFEPNPTNTTQTKDTNKREAGVPPATEEERRLEKEEKRRRKAARREEKRVKKEMRKLKREEDERIENDDRQRKRSARSRSRSPRPRDRHTSQRYRRRSFTPPVR
ncbi:hypothetical protein M378DRAFT_191503 [Amanita muscaria Koide BX008]|uniref:Multiple myeloma tumor-associated protein 2-like N-terminal domain-containing protein n=1 Tax=Amanita muscaria (strain Koide BX008) TaxID=946122 RepID=A0A0C2TKC0_AMAMK|nr:hypothetical protein M378DRAFT_191503 [Amanita muscaria Koide BX008]